MKAQSQLIVQSISDVTIATITDSSLVEAGAIAQLQGDLLELVEKRACRRLVLEMGKVKHFSSAALGMLLPLQDAVKRNKGKLVLSGVREDLRKVFKITKLEKRFTFKPNERESLAHFNVKIN